MSEPAEISELDSKTQELRDILSYYWKAFALYVAIHGALLKFALDADSTPQLRSALTLLGIGLSVLGVVTCIFGARLRRAFLGDIRRLRKKLGADPVPSDGLPLKYMVILSSIFVGIGLVGWIVVLVTA